MTNSDIKELFARYMNIENEIKMLQEDKKQVLAEFKDRVEPKVFRAALSAAKTKAKLKTHEANEYDQVMNILEDQLAIDHVVSVSSSKTAELVKVYENTFRAVNIALANQMALLCHEMDIDVWEMLDAAFTKPFGIMPFYPGPGVGGHCIPIDPHYLEWKAKEYGFNTRLINLAGEINRSMPAFVVSRVQDLLNNEKKSLSGAKIFIVGVTYKANVADYRESPAMDVVKLLEEKGAEINYFDPLIDSFELECKQYKKTDINKDVLSHQDCVVILAKHDSVDYNFIKQNSGLVFDTRNVFSDRSNIETL